MIGQKATVLDRILARKREEIEALKSRPEAAELRRRCLEQPPPRDLAAALKNCPRVPIIAEIKKASPSAGTLNGSVPTAKRARAYQAGGAAALSILTDGPFFHGSLGDLEEARRAVTLPVLRKDFILEPVQLYESRAAGADAILLIAAALEESRLEDLFYQALLLGLTPLVEVHDAEELAAVLPLKPSLLGINNRNLATLEVTLATTENLMPLVPAGTLVVSESGIAGAKDVTRLQQAGVTAFLIGTTLMKSGDPEAELACLCRAGG
ncbi:MAG: indole-3-glycerol phosphate synthase TrpC [Thermodesulfobacteriota bacterium]